jgi:hypothetical protein
MIVRISCFGCRGKGRLLLSKEEKNCFIGGFELNPNEKEE